jgi:hypothetical protein
LKIASIFLDARFKAAARNFTTPFSLSFFFNGAVPIDSTISTQDNRVYANDIGIVTLPKYFSCSPLTTTEQNDAVSGISSSSEAFAMEFKASS